MSEVADPRLAFECKWIIWVTILGNMDGADGREERGRKPVAGLGELAPCHGVLGGCSPEDSRRSVSSPLQSPHLQARQSSTLTPAALVGLLLLILPVWTNQLSPSRAATWGAFWDTAETVAGPQAAGHLHTSLMILVPSLGPVQVRRTSWFSDL